MKKQDLINQSFSDLENAIFNPAEALEYLEITDLSLENLRRIKKMLVERPPSLDNLNKPTRILL